MIRQATERLIVIKYLFILIAMFDPCSLLLACKVDSVTLKTGTTAFKAKNNGLVSIDIPIGDKAFFYATCEVGENPDELDIKWEFDLDDDGDYDDYSDTSAYDEPYMAVDDWAYDVGHHANIKVQACLDDGIDTWAELPEVDYCDVDVVKVEIVSPVPASFPKYIGIDAGLTLISEITPRGATGGTFSWSKVSGPGTATFSPSNDSTTSFSADTVGSYTVKVEYAIGEGTCSDTAGTIEVVNAKMIFKAGTPPVEASSLTRGESGTFEIVDDEGDPISGATYAAWYFDGEIDAIDSSNTSSTWSGTIVEPGTASANVTFGGETVHVSKTITMTARAWSITPHLEPDNEADWGAYPSLAVLGLNRDEHTNDAKIIWPRGTNYEDGYSVTEITSGPNNGIYYISDCTFAIDRESCRNKYAEPGATGYPDPPNTGWYEFNATQSVDIAGLSTAILNHEGYGTAPANEGHQRFIEDEEAEADAKAEIEDFIGYSESTIKTRVGNIVVIIDNAIFFEGATEPTDGSNWGPATLYYYDFAVSAWDTVTHAN